MKKLLKIGILCLLILSCKNEKQDSTGSQSDTSIPKIKFEKLHSTVLASGRLFRADSFPSQYITPRPVDVWLPENYSEERKYAVLYMHDGQMLFDSTTSWNKQEWKVDEWASQLMYDEKINDFIVIAIHNIPQIRWQDLYPEKSYGFMPDSLKVYIEKNAKGNNFSLDFKGDDYLKFLVKELKPVIDMQYAVHTDSNNTFVMGSSMGGLMSMYAISEYPNVFGGAACLSTHWPGAMPQDNNPFPEAIFSYMDANFPVAGNHKVYFDYGDRTLDKYYPQYAPRVDAVLKAKGFDEEDYRNLFFEGTDHSENSWNQRLDKPLLFLLGK
ncbi:alpha/beta hydrolase [Winogradskyella aurantia]|uniref:Esterase n=1 Tax=Winogradskyella aurantia TaxID=1915063 RepID=A0A265UVW4_9FLAO|nr:alpha/beta hydrolase-fold protein [Winogradskyella aurantia]OZV69342.1 esterase [Winogradskyella aurantia]